MPIDKRFSLITNDGQTCPLIVRENSSLPYDVFAPHATSGDAEEIATIEEVIDLVVNKGYKVRVKRIGAGGKEQRNGIKLNGDLEAGYSIDATLAHLVQNAAIKPLSEAEIEAIPNSSQTSANAAASSPPIELASNVVDKVQLRAINTRRGQPAFRKLVLNEYKNKCCITECEILNVLEAAHITPHKEGSDYSVSNGLLLRSDIHLLYDIGLLRIDSHGRIFIDDSLKGSEYAKYDGKPISRNISGQKAALLQQRYESFSKSES